MGLGRVAAVRRRYVRREARERRLGDGTLAQGAAMCTVRATGLTETSDKVDLVVAAVQVSSSGLHATV